MKPWDQVLPLVLPHCPGCSDLIAESEVRNAAEDFLARSFTWRYTAGAIMSFAGEGFYTPVLPSNSRIVKLHAGTYNGASLAVEKTEATTGLPNSITTPDRVRLEVSPPPAEDNVKITADLSLSLKTSATGLPDELFDQYRQAIAHGAIQRLCLHVGKSYSNPGMAVARGAMFEEAIADEKSAKVKGNTSTRKRVVLQTL